MAQKKYGVSRSLTVYVRLDVYDLTGHKVKDIITGELEAGDFLYRWIPSPSVPDGVYVYRMTIKKAGDFQPASYLRKCILIR